MQFADTTNKTRKCPVESNRTNSGEGHMAGSNNCEVKTKERVIKKTKPTEEWEEKELLKSWRERMSLQDRTLDHILHISDVRWIQKIIENSTRRQ